MAGSNECGNELPGSIKLSYLFFFFLLYSTADGNVLEKYQGLEV